MYDSPKYLLFFRAAHILEEIRIGIQHHHVALTLKAVFVSLLTTVERIELRIAAIGLIINLSRLGVP